MSRADDPVPAREAPAIAVALRAGPLRLVFDRGELRWIRLGEREVLRGIYFALRAEGWTTVPYEISNLEIAAEPESFRIAFLARHERGPARFDWRADIAGCPDGRISFAVRGAAGSGFLRNRIGLCVLHPAETCAGRSCIVETVDGDRAESVFPALVAPQQPFRNVRAILHEVSPGVEVEVRMEGEAFETEDQGNWGDASYKTYGTPLHLPHPVPETSGASVEQSVAVRLFGITTEPVEHATATVPGALPGKRDSPEPVVVAFGAEAERPLPAIGLAGAELAALSDADAARLRPLRLAHVRADLHLEAEAWGAALERAAANARLLDVPLEIALFLPDDAQDVLRELAAKADLVHLHHPFPLGELSALAFARHTKVVLTWYSAIVGQKMLARLYRAWLERVLDQVPKVTYNPEGTPYIALRIQELFDVTAIPKIAMGRVPVLVHILAPSMRPVQITQDLAGFWHEHYPRLKQELQRKYPKHLWR